jgi:hypothetical protein
MLSLWSLMCGTESGQLRDGPKARLETQGTVQPIEAGYYRPILRRVDGGWKITTLRITHSLLMAFPGKVSGVNE